MAVSQANYHWSRPLTASQNHARDREERLSLVISLDGTRLGMGEVTGWAARRTVTWHSQAQ
jgi:hypothetical protein